MTFILHGFGGELPVRISLALATDSDYISSHLVHSSLLCGRAYPLALHIQLYTLPEFMEKLNGLTRHANETFLFSCQVQATQAPTAASRRCAGGVDRPLGMTGGPIKVS